jgi:WhiB family redox-sensing transcriptional regulator
MEQGVATNIIHETWHLQASCRGPESQLFFPPAVGERREERDRREAGAKVICNGCAVRTDCLDFAVRVRERDRMWGGVTESERRLVWEDE